MPKFYVASKTKHAPVWQDWRGRGVNIVSTWIDEAGAGQTKDHGELWERIFNEIRSLVPEDGDALVYYFAHDDDPAEGAHLEVGGALILGIPVLSVGKPHKTAHKHALYERYKSIHDAFASRGVHVPEPQR